MISSRPLNSPPPRPPPFFFIDKSSFFFIFFYKSRFLLKFVLVLLYASVKRVGVSRMHFFLFCFLVCIGQKLRPKRKKPAFFAQKRNMVFEDGLKIKLYPNLMFFSFTVLEAQKIFLKKCFLNASNKKI